MMDPETIHLMHDGLCRTVLMLIQGITLGIGLATVLLILLGLAAAALDCRVQLIRAARRPPAPAPEMPGSDADAPRVALAGRNVSHADRLTGGLGRRAPALTLPSARQPEGF